MINPMKLLDDDKARALLLGRRSSQPTPVAQGTAPPPPPQPGVVKSNPLTRKLAMSSDRTSQGSPLASSTQNVPAPPPPPPAAKITKVHNHALEQLLNESTGEVNVDAIDLNNLDITNVDINFEEIEDFKLVKDALLKGVDLKQYSLQIETSLAQVDKESVADYFAERENFVKLYYQLNDVDGVLGKFEELLSNFQRDLRSISSEIRNLQTQTMSMNMKLRNRKNVEEKVSKFVEDISITQDLRDHISKDEINENYLKYLIVLDKKLSVAAKYKKEGAIAITDTESHQQKLLAKAVSRVQKYLIASVTGFRTSQERKQKQKELGPLGYLFQFLFKHASQAATDLVASYVDSCTSFYTNFYRNYASAFERSKDADASRTEYLTSSGGNKLKNMASFIAKSVHIGGVGGNKNVQGTFFALGSRADILAQLDQPPQEPPVHTNLLVNLAHAPSFHSPSTPTTPTTPTGLPHTHSSSGLSHSHSSSSFSPATPTGAPSTPTFNSPTTPNFNPAGETSGASNPGAPSTRYPYEVILRNNLLQLMDIVASEHMFVVDFFLAGDDVSLAIFGKCINLFTESTAHYLHNTVDIVGMMLSLCILHKYVKVMAERRVGVLDPLFQKQSQNFLVQLTRVFNENCEHLKNATLKELKPIEVAPHIVTRRFADLLASVAFLLPQLPDEPKNSVSNSFKNLRQETDKLIQKMADEIDKKDKTSFIISNYGFVVTTAQERGVQPTDPLLGPFRKVFERHSSQFIDEQLGPYKYFTAMMNFVKEWGPLVEGGVRIDEATNPKFNKDVVENILREFDTNWKIGMEDVKKNIKRYFALSPVAAAQMLELILEYVHNHYKQLINIVNKCFKQLKTSSFYRPDQVMVDMRNTNVF